ncbi:hypothetical protein GQ42DRAFT_175966 [Ramicandelaber brevisporus]|nr:hypothetical protein GQ42DRAFT_175966 [Ramicandelaber brevisporus]
MAAGREHVELPRMFMRFDMALSEPVNVNMADTNCAPAFDRAYHRATCLFQTTTIEHQIYLFALRTSNPTPPFYRLGTSVVDACARFGTDYVDITGEYEWVRSMHRRYNAVAERSGALIVPFCGFDSLPSELGSLMVADAFRRRYGSDPDEVRHSVVVLDGRVSGGTMSTMMSIMSGDAPNAITSSESQYLADASPADVEVSKLSPVPSTAPINPLDFISSKTFYWDSEIKRWQGIFLMCVCNVPVVNWSNKLRSLRRDVDAKLKNLPTYPYKETQSYSNLLFALAVASVLGVFSVLASFGLGRWILNRILPAPGEGPSDKRITKGSYKGVFIAEKKSEQAGEAPLKIRGHVVAASDPGYGETVRYVCESALCVLNKRTELPLQAGVSPPGYGLGLTLLNHLRAAGCEFVVTE